MRAARITTAASLLLFGFSTATSHAVRYLGIEGRSTLLKRDAEEMARDTVIDLEKRQSSSETIQSGPSSSNGTIAEACMDVLADITAITNDAGLAACYNIMSMEREQRLFTADLRLYLAAPPKGAFMTVQPDNLMIGVTYPSSTVFTTMNTRRMVRKRQESSSSIANMTEIQQYTLMGSIDPTIDLDKLTNDQVMSLMIPAITVNAVSEATRQPVDTALTTTDTAYFVVGLMRGEFSADAANPQFQAAAIEQSSVFVLPGTTFGIFPVGMIVTLAWLLIFVAAYGFGTFKRYQHREFYRKRMHMAAGMSGAMSGGGPGHASKTGGRK
jgi:hypothetical protein